MNFSKKLISWYAANQRNLPWRKTQNPYFIWLSEIILQQTKIEQGLPYYQVFVTKYPTIYDLAKASEQEVLKSWQGLGYYSRARNLHHTAKYIVNELQGNFPNTYQDLLKLKGVGDYTASAIASICFNEASAVVDGNVYRVLSRYFGIEVPINTTSGKKKFKALAQKLINKDAPALFNQAIMDFGSQQCKPKSPNCTICPLQHSCHALQKNKVATLPIKIKTPKPIKKHYNFLVFLDEKNQTCIEKRLENGIWKNLYQFPLVETKNQANIADIEKYINQLKQNKYSLYIYNQKPIVHKLTHLHLYTSFWVVECHNIKNNAVAINQLQNYPFPVLISNFIERFWNIKA